MAPEMERGVNEERDFLAVVNVALEDALDKAAAAYDRVEALTGLKSLCLDASEANDWGPVSYQQLEALATTGDQRARLDSLMARILGERPPSSPDKPETTDEEEEA
jgi:hypothetical protein